MLVKAGGKTVIWGGKEAYVLVPRAGTENYEEIKENSQVEYKTEGRIQEANGRCLEDSRYVVTDRIRL